MACENDKCEKYGMHHDYKNGVEVRKCQFCMRDDQPERSKREDSLLRELIESSSGKLDISETAESPWIWDKDLNFIGHKVLKEMRCSEHYGNIMREVQ